jgi:RNA polymerase sigma factor (sigma-70 family)
MTDSQRLISEYLENGSEPAFRELVVRYVDLVYSVALRMTDGDSHLAEDISQTVFADLSRMARKLSSDVMLGGWLHRHTCFVASTVMRGERRRRAREKEAVEMNVHRENSETDFSQVAPFLDEAINELADVDRKAILLRFFEQHEFREIGAVIGSNEDAARMRVTRALEKLELLLKKRGVTTTAIALSTTISTNAIQTAPAALGNSIAAALSAAGAGSAGAYMWLTSSQVIKLGAALLTAALITPIFMQHKQIVRLRSDNAEFVQRIQELEKLRADNQPPTALEVDTNELAGLRREHAELLRLRGEVTQLGNELRRRATERETATNNAASRASAQNPWRLSYQAAAVATVPDGATFIAGGWHSDSGKRSFFLITPKLNTGTEQSSRTVTTAAKLVEFAEEDLSSAVRAKIAHVNNQGSGYSFLQSAPVFLENDAGFQDLIQASENPEKASILGVPTINSVEGEEARVSIGQQVPTLATNGAPAYEFLGTSMRLTAKIKSDGTGISIEAMISFTPTPDKN